MTEMTSDPWEDEGYAGEDDWGEESIAADIEEEQPEDADADDGDGRSMIELELEPEGDASADREP
ncbi:MAG: hypothetical protein R6W48_08145 [Gaiellaceae bacterium]